MLPPLTRLPGAFRLPAEGPDGRYGVDRRNGAVLPARSRNTPTLGLLTLTFVEPLAQIEPVTDFYGYDEVRQRRPQQSEAEADQDAHGVLHAVTAP